MGPEEKRNNYQICIGQQDTGSKHTSLGPTFLVQPDHFLLGLLILLIVVLPFADIKLVFQLVFFCWHLLSIYSSSHFLFLRKYVCG